ncbi:MAG TPA: dihydroneopterin aldolase [Gammaproteobacteria bacterium]|nr:dihydroneopterin aldolase [Gammaproteobacteria bacterium]
MDIVFIRELKVDTVVGIYEWERRIRQNVILDLDMAADIGRAAKSDRIEDTLDYKAVAKRVAQYVSGAEFKLVETLAEKVAELVMKEFGIRWVKVSLNKPGAVSGSKSVGVVIERGKKD